MNLSSGLRLWSREQVLHAGMGLVHGGRLRIVCNCPDLASKKNFACPILHPHGRSVSLAPAFGLEAY